MRTLSAIGGAAALAVLWLGACGGSERTPFEPGRDAGVDVAREAEGQACRPSNGPDEWLPPSQIATREVTINGIACQHPAVRPDCANRWCKIPAGCFVMGSPEVEWGRGAYNEDEIAVTLTHDFMVQQYEMTRREWLALGFPLDSGANAQGEEGGDCDKPECPAASVSWFDAVAFANALSDRSDLARCYEPKECAGSVGKDFRCNSVEQKHASLYECPGYRLPMEAEWEYAVRAGTRTAFYSGAITPQAYNFFACCEDRALGAIAWYCHNARGWTYPGGLKAPNAWGLYDMAGNAWEWVNDPFEGSTPKGPLVDYGSTLTMKDRALTRGGSARFWGGLHRSASAALDYSRNERASGVNFGFRLVRTLFPSSAADASADQ